MSLERRNCSDCLLKGGHIRATHESTIYFITMNRRGVITIAFPSGKIQGTYHSFGSWWVSWAHHLGTFELIDRDNKERSPVDGGEKGPT